MFYSKEILTKKKCGFGIIWLASTLGSRSHLRKLSRKEINSVNLVKACGYLSSPPEPLALRLSSNLLYGITRLYQQQYQFYYVDTNNLWLKFQKALSEFRNESVDMSTSEARQEAITLRDDPYFEIEMLINKSNDTDMVFEIERQIDWILSSEQEIPNQVLTNNRKNDNNRSRRSLITLPEEIFSSGDGEFTQSLSTGFGGGFGFSLNDDDLLRIEDNNGGVGGGGMERSGVVVDEEGITDGLNSDTIKEIEHRVRDEHNNVDQSRDHKRRRTELQIHDGVENHHDFQNTVEVYEQQGQDEQRIGQDEMEVVIEPRVIDEEENNRRSSVSTQPRRRRRRRLQNMYDEPAELTNEQILQMRESVVVDLDIAEQKAREKNVSQKYKDQWNNILYTSGLPLRARPLVTLWENHCAPMLQDDIVRQRTTHPPPMLSSNDIYLQEPISLSFTTNIPEINKEHDRTSSLQDVESEVLRRGESSTNVSLSSGLRRSRDSSLNRSHDSSGFNYGGSASGSDFFDLSGVVESVDNRNQRNSIGFNRALLDLSKSNSGQLSDFPIVDDNYGGDEGNGSLASEYYQGRYYSSRNRSIGSSVGSGIVMENDSNLNQEHESMAFMESVKSLMYEAKVTSAIYQDIIDAHNMKQSQSELTQKLQNQLNQNNKLIISQLQTFIKSELGNFKNSLEEK
ncbi:10780_t:CDS:10 [Entrophospora sp. SA101]|nr:10780_t:CDS:10 [Entrophospora sp. SA101]